MNRSYSKIRHIQESNMLLERRKLNLILEFDQIKMDSMVAETQELAKGAVGITFGDMKVLSASVVASQPKNWKLNGAIRLLLNTNHGGIAKQIAIGLLTDATGEVKIVGTGGTLNSLDAIGIRKSLDMWLGEAYKQTLDRATKQDPSPYKTLITVLTGIANKYKTSGLAAPTK